MLTRTKKKLVILNAAMKVFARSGVVKTKMADIAVEAGIGKGTIYEYYQSKEELFAASFAQFFKILEDAMGDIIMKDINPVEKLRQIMETSTATITEKSPEFVEIMMDFWAEGVRSKHTEFLKILDLEKFYLEFRAMFVQILRDGVEKGVFKSIDPQIIASALIALMDGMLLQWIISRDIFNPRQAMKISLDALLNGIVNK